MIADPRLRLPDRLAWLAGLLALIAALVGLVVPDLYRDRPILVDATRVDNAFQVVIVLPLLAVALVLARRGSVTARLTAVGCLLYLAYFFGLYAIAGTLNAMSLVHIAVTGLAFWALVLGVPGIDAPAAERAVGQRLWRRSTVIFLVLVAAFHIPLWAAQILASVVSGELPASLVTFGWLNTPVYTFDLALALPIGIAAAVLLARRDARGSVLGVPFLLFSGLLALDVCLELVSAAMVSGDWAGVPEAVPFGVIAVLSGLLLLPILSGRARRTSAGAPVVDDGGP